MKKLNLAWMVLLAFLLSPLSLRAQSVTVDPTTGNLVASLTVENETGFENGWSAMWRHEQLPLTFTTADTEDLTESGEIATPACNIWAQNSNLIIGGGMRPDLYCVLSLPKGYRFKGYKMVLLNNLNNTTINSMRTGSQTKVMYETDNTFNITNYKARGYYSDSPNTYQMGGTNSSTREYVIEREAGTDVSSMGNQLYFRLNHTYTNNRYVYVTIKSFTVYFTAEGTFEAEAKPASADVALSLVRSPFKTNKIDIGKLEQREKNNKTFFAYTYTNVRDIDAHTYIYQEDAIAGGVPMNVAPVKKIHPVTIGGNQYFAFENGIYYVESPTLVYSQTGLSYPIGFRIVGAKFTPQWGSAVTGTSENKTLYYITYTSGGTTYYLNDLLHFTTTRFGWNYDSTTKNLYVGSGNNAEYLACEGSGGTRTLTLSYANGSYYNLEVFTQSGVTYVGWADGGTWEGNAQSFYLIGTTDSSAPVQMVRSYQSADHSTAARVSSGTESVTYASYTPGAYTLNIYDKTGTSVAATKTVNSASDAGTAIELTDHYVYNNDAVKFEITGLAEGRQALVDVSVFMQALNPYIDQMNIICHDNADQLSLSQNFTAENFMVSGGKFNFYIPTEYSTSDLHFTFSDLWSQYGDNTYYTGNSTLQKDGYARYSFVTSPYFELIDQNGDNGLYDDAYDPNAVYTNKVIATKAGNIRYKFNNAEGLDNENPAPNTNYLEEYPFTAANYVGSTDPDGSSTTGAFVDCTMNAQDTESTIYFLFTADETRYNIAPSTAWQHRYYAFYRMEIDLQTSSYDPKLTWTKVYDETCFVKDGAEAHDAMFGLKLATVDHDTQAAMTGYLTVKQISDAVTAALGSTNAPTTADQILYMDGSDLYSIINSSVTSGGTTTTMTLENLKNMMADNVLIYLPENMTSTLPNIAYKPSEWTTGTPFRAATNIELTDRAPFYAPYDIQVDTDKEAVYERQISKDSYGKVQNASLIMPFQLKVEDGKHTNTDGTYFTLHKMQTNQSIELQGGKPYAYFPSELADVTVTAPHTPYLVNLEESQNSSKDGISFLVSQTGTLIKATTGATAANDGYTYFFGGETSQGTVAEGGTYEGGTYTLTNQGTYAGQAIDKTKGVFYFARNRFVNSAELASSIETVKIYPFRSYYKVAGSARGFSTMNVIFGEGTVEDAILDLEEKQADMVVRAGRGTLTITSAVDNTVRINGINGISHYNLGLGAGESKTVRVPAGVYVVNGAKILVK